MTSSRTGGSRSGGPLDAHIVHLPRRRGERRPLVRYTAAVRSIADEFRAESRERMARLSPAERVELALALGDSDVTLLCAARGISRDEAVQVIRQGRQHGRRRAASTQKALP